MAIIVCPSCGGTGTYSRHEGRDGWQTFTCTTCGGERVVDEQITRVLKRLQPIPKHAAQNKLD
ncbi:hypothetical protein [Leisingera sp. MMG026]|uniref:hypothetical protein n=1 Tax=Leisingera sp. MMG026 TaxID=2909982 RepID=UPI001F2CA80C|nr:hypothetical protein [Leisingera sp. MMG026]MCF6432645.1 hypothetical protein [Leisingera sp. MMG026]